MIPFSFMAQRGPGEDPGCSSFLDLDNYTLTALASMASLADGFDLVAGTEIVFSRIEIPEGLTTGGSAPLEDSLYRASNPFSGDADSHDGFIYLSAIMPGEVILWVLSMDRITNATTPLNLGVFGLQVEGQECSQNNPEGDFALYIDPGYPNPNLTCAPTPPG
jgi:hypothetical protein